MIVYLAIINAVSLVLMSTDKLLAIKKCRRIPESTLLLSAILGGSFGAAAGMYLCRHKTRHPKFSIGLPVLVCLQTALLLYLFYR